MLGHAGRLRVLLTRWCATRPTTWTSRWSPRFGGSTQTRGRSVGEVCPGCGPVSNRVHGSCQRRLQDLPFGGQRVGILLRHLRRAVLATNLCAATPSQIAHAPDSEAAVLRPSSHIRQR
ncbi:transposase family protein [Streptomyces canus]|uniref:transposase family protein n=1 Tax=Streptomyces canus TaxID=58343 RepID=UPI003AF37D0F